MRRFVYRPVESLSAERSTESTKARIEFEKGYHDGVDSLSIRYHHLLVTIRASCLLLILLVVAGESQSGSVRIEINALNPQLIQSRLESVTGKMPVRRATIESLFRDAGCDGQFLFEKPIPHLKDPNIVCVLPGTGDTRIVVGGHYDFVERGIGAVDDWSGSALLPSLYQSLKTKTRRDTFVFIAFAGEESGLHGSGAYVKQLTADERGRIHAMVNLECLGTSPPKVWATRANQRLLGLYLQLTKSTGVKAEASNVDDVGDDDSHPFLSARIPVITIHSITQETFPILHTPADNLKAIHPDYYYDAYHLVTNYLALLDQTIE
jgi:hypothetical protein